MREVTAYKVGNTIYKTRVLAMEAEKEAERLRRLRVFKSSVDSLCTGLGQTHREEWLGHLAIHEYFISNHLAEIFITNKDELIRILEDL